MNVGEKKTAAEFFRTLADKIESDDVSRAFVQTYPHETSCDKDNWCKFKIHLTVQAKDRPIIEHFKAHEKR